MSTRELGILGVAVALMIMAVHLTSNAVERIDDRVRVLEQAAAVHMVGHPERRSH